MCGVGGVELELSGGWLGRASDVCFACMCVTCRYVRVRAHVCMCVCGCAHVSSQIAVGALQEQYANCCSARETPGNYAHVRTQLHRGTGTACLYVAIRILSDAN